MALAASLALALVAPILGLAPSAPAIAATTPDLTVVTAATYDVRPADGLVHVTVAITARNHKADTRAQTYYFDNAYLSLPPGIHNLTYAGTNPPSRATVVVVKKTSTSTLVSVGFGGHLYSLTSRTFSLEFDITDPGGDAARQVRISSSLAVFPVWAFASAGSTGSTVSVHFPAGFAVSVESGSFAKTTTAADGSIVLTTGAIADPQAFFAYVLGERPPDVTDTSLGVIAGGSLVTLTVRAWADDPAWGARVGDLVAAALPLLSDDIGLPWPDAAPRVVAESVNRTTGGPSGVFDAAAGRIDVAYWADPLVTIHETAHGWFNGSLVADRWIAEGFAALYAERTAAALEAAGTSPVLTEAVGKAAFPLNDWTAQGTAAVSAPDKAVDDFGFAASLAVAKLIADEAGDEVMHRVWADAVLRIAPYQPPLLLAPGRAELGIGTEPEVVAGPPDWRALLDLLEDRPGKDFSGLWRTWVVDDAQSPLLDARTASRLSYARTLALADGWALPRSIRDAMRAWQFDTADALLADARAVLADRASTEARAERMGLQLPSTIQRLFESGSLRTAAAEARAENDVMQAIRTATAERPADPDPLTRIGLLGTRPDEDLAAARSALAAGNNGEAIAAADAALAQWSSAWGEGRRRTMLAVAAAAAVLVLVSWTVGRVRDRRRPDRRHARPATRPRGARPA